MYQGQKYNVGGVWDGSTLKLFVGTTLVGSIGAASINPSGVYIFGIGGYVFGNINKFSLVTGFCFSLQIGRLR